MENIAEEKAKADAIFNSIGDGAIATDEHGRIVRVNQIALDLFGYQMSEMVGTWYPKIVKAIDEHGTPINSIALPITKALLSGKPVSSRSFYTKKDNSKLPVSVTVSPILLNNRPIGAIEVFRDITHELEIEKAKSEFISLASHQLKTPPTAMSWNVDILLDGTAGKVNQDQLKILKSMKEISNKMIETVNALLNVSRLELGTFIVDPKPINFVSVAKEVILELQPQITSKKLKLSVDFDTDIPDISADPSLAKIIIENLLSNAVKYTPTEGKISISIKKNTPDKPPGILIVVSDTGFGIPKAQQSKIFQKMFRADNIVQKADGTGFGLYLLKSIIEMADGTIKFDSEENKGTTFYVELPQSGMKKKDGTSRLTPSIGTIH